MHSLTHFILNLLSWCCEEDALGVPIGTKSGLFLVAFFRLVVCEFLEVIFYWLFLQINMKNHILITINIWGTETQASSLKASASFLPKKKLFFEKKTNEGVSFFSEGVIRHAGFSLNDKWQMSARPLKQALFYFWSRFSEASRLRASSFLQEK